MTLTDVLEGGRRRAEALHTDTFTVYRATGQTISDPDTLEETPQYVAVATGIKGKLQTGQTQPRETQLPGQKVVETALTWHTSINTHGVVTDDEVECTAVNPDHGDPDLVGVRVRITGPFIKSAATARRFPVEEIS